MYSEHVQLLVRAPSTSTYQSWDQICPFLGLREKTNHAIVTFLGKYIPINAHLWVGPSFLFLLRKLKAETFSHNFGTTKINTKSIQNTLTARVKVGRNNALQFNTLHRNPIDITGENIIMLYWNTLEIILAATQVKENCSHAPGCCFALLSSNRITALRLVLLPMASSLYYVQCTLV